VTHTEDIGIRSLATALPERFAAVEALRTTSPAETLRGFGFPGAWVDGDVSRLAEDAAAKAIERAGVEIDALLWASALAASHEHPSTLTADERDVLRRFCYQGSWLQERLGLEKASVSGIAQQGCAGMFAAMRQARALIAAEAETSNVLCVGADAFPPDADREVLYNVISDAGCACVLSREEVLYRWVGYHQVSRGYYWDVPAKQSEIIAAYFPTAALTVRGVLKKTALQPSDIDLVIPTGVNRNSWPILMRLCGIPEERLYQPVQSFGHTIAADSLLMLEEVRDRGGLRPGMKLLLFAYGFGSSWCALILETTDLI
jgi:3-oxoacyl-[acyl-carrier-protein] synthase III